MEEHTCRHRTCAVVAHTGTPTGSMPLQHTCTAAWHCRCRPAGRAAVWSHQHGGGQEVRARFAPCFGCPHPLVGCASRALSLRVANPAPCSLKQQACAQFCSRCDRSAVLAACSAPCSKPPWSSHIPTVAALRRHDRRGWPAPTACSSSGSWCSSLPPTSWTCLWSSSEMQQAATTEDD